MLNFIRRLFGRQQLIVLTPDQALEMLNDAVYLAALNMGVRWVIWRLQEAQETLADENNEATQALNGLHAVHRFRATEMK